MEEVSLGLLDVVLEQEQQEELVERLELELVFQLLGVGLPY